jgi:hypothetical protein
VEFGPKERIAVRTWKPKHYMKEGGQWHAYLARGLVEECNYVRPELVCSRRSEYVIFIATGR